MRVSCMLVISVINNIQNKFIGPSIFNLHMRVSSMPTDLVLDTDQSSDLGARRLARLEEGRRLRPAWTNQSSVLPHADQ